MFPPSRLLGKVLFNGAASRVAQEANAAPPRQLPQGLSRERSFSFFGGEMEPYDPHAIEPKWQQVWDEAGAFAVPNPDPGTPPNPDKRYVLEQLPYPSGTVHMGHMLVYTIGDVRSHFQRRTGHEVMR